MVTSTPPLKAGAAYSRQGGGVLFVGGSKGGSIAPNLTGGQQMNTANFGGNSNGYTTGTGSLSIGAKFGAMFSHGETWVGN